MFMDTKHAVTGSEKGAWTSSGGFRSFTPTILMVIFWLILSLGLHAQTLPKSCKLGFTGVNYDDEGNSPSVIINPCSFSGIGFYYSNTGCTNCPGPYSFQVFGSPTQPGLVYTQNTDGTAGGSISPSGTEDDIVPGTITVTMSCGDGSSVSISLLVYVNPSCSGGTSGACPASTIPSFGTATPVLGSVDLQVSLGRRAFGVSAGFLSIKQFEPTNTLATPGRLRYRFPTNSGCELITNGAGIILQVKAPECLANVYTNAGDFCRYWIDIYASSAVTTNKDADGRYILSGSPMLSHTICNPDTTGNTTNQLKITDGNGIVSDYVWKTNGWTLTNGGGLQKIYKPTVWSASNTVRTVSTETRDAADNLVHTKATTYTTY